MENNYGTVKITNDGVIEDVNIKNFTQQTFQDGRFITIAELENDSFLVSLENPLSSGRSNQSLHLTRKSF